MNNIIGWDSLPALYASGAYGRKYDTLEDVLIDWLEGLDFKVISGPYFSIRDAEVLRADGYGLVDVDGYILPIV